jgi:nicotinamide-nucleotide amidase
MGEPLEASAPAERMIAERLGRALLERDRRQTMAPRGAELLENPRGSAPGLRATVGGGTIYILPGVPHEMRGMFREQVLPEIVRAARSALEGRGRICSARRYLVVHGMPEAEVSKRLEGVAREGEDGTLRVGTRTRSGVITVRLRAIAATEEGASRLAEEALGAARDRLGDAALGEGDRTLAELVAEAALGKNLTLAVAESCTGGMIASALVAVPGISEALVEGTVAYSNDAKVRRLGVSGELIEQKGAVSAEVARAMAAGAREKSGADLAVAVTGVAGPGGGTEAKPVGLVYIATATRAGTEAIERRFRGERQVVRDRTTQTALRLLLEEARRLPAAAGGD